MNPEPYDPEATLFQAVATLERRGYTRDEITEALADVTRSVERMNHRFEFEEL